MLVPLQKIHFSNHSLELTLIFSKQLLFFVLDFLNSSFYSFFHSYIYKYVHDNKGSLRISTIINNNNNMLLLVLLLLEVIVH